VRTKRSTGVWLYVKEIAKLSMIFQKTIPNSVNNVYWRYSTFEIQKIKNIQTKLIFVVGGGGEIRNIGLTDLKKT